MSAAACEGNLSIRSTQSTHAYNAKARADPCPDRCWVRWRSSHSEAQDVCNALYVYAKAIVGREEKDLARRHDDDARQNIVQTRTVITIQGGGEICESTIITLSAFFARHVSALRHVDLRPAEGNESTVDNHTRILELANGLEPACRSREVRTVICEGTLREVQFLNKCEDSPAKFQGRSSRFSQFYQPIQFVSYADGFLLECLTPGKDSRC